MLQNNSMLQYPPASYPISLPLASIQPLIIMALEEDIQNQDCTTQATVAPASRARAELVAKQAGVLCGTSVFHWVFQTLDPTVSIVWNAREGDLLSASTTVATCVGATASLLTGERTALNFLQRMSGIATRVNHLVQQLTHTHTRLLDTRKTVPGFRLLDKYAVRIGGGTNHRMGLYDMILIKENHIRSAGSITQAIQLVRSRFPDLMIEVETTTEEEVMEACANFPNIIMLDNMNNEQVRVCQEKISDWNRRHTTHIQIECSGNMNEVRMMELAHLGVDFISMGSLTHSVQAFDFSLQIYLV